MHTEYFSNVDNVLQDHYEDDLTLYEDSDDDSWYGSLYLEDDSLHLDNIMESYLSACNIRTSNDCHGPITLLRERDEDGLWDPLDIECLYKTEWGNWYLRVCLLELDKVYLYKLEYDIERLYNPDWVKYRIDFDLNAIMNSLDASRNDINVYIFTCECADEYCERNPFELEMDNTVEFEKIFVIRPILEKDLLSEPIVDNSTQESITVF